MEENKMTEDWEKLLTMLAETHTYTMYNLCRDLKCSRTWIKTYVLPYLKEQDAVISLGNGYPFGKSISGQRAKPWTFIIQQKLRALKKDNSIIIKDLLWFDKKAFENFVYDHSTATQQVKAIPLDYFIKPEERRSFASTYRKLMNDLDYVTTPYQYRKIISLQNKLFEDALSYNGRLLLENGERFPNKRGEVKALQPVPVPKVEFSLWKAVHDIKAYGDTDEAVYRDLFKTAAIRVELNITNPEKEKISTEEEEKQELKDGHKVFYVADVDPVFNGYHLPCRLIEASIWEEVKNDFI